MADNGLTTSESIALYGHPLDRHSRTLFRAPPERWVRRVRAWRDRFNLLVRVLPQRPRPTGLVVWEGPSRLTGEPVVVVVTCLDSPTVNPKTGDVLQVYILPGGVHPREAVRSGRDRSVCGDCPQRPSVGGACYVNAGWAPSNVWRSWRKGAYPRLDADGIALLFDGAALRFGAWGDPAAVPLDVWAPLVAGASTHLGYTHAWRDLDAADWGWLMASVDSVAEAREARDAGWRTFRVDYGRRGAALAGEIQCPAQQHHVTCLACGACAGTRSPHRGSVWIAPHGMRVEGGRKKDQGGTQPDERYREHRG